MRMHNQNVHIIGRPVKEIVESIHGMPNPRQTLKLPLDPVVVVMVARVAL